ncbi:MAG: ABC transporter ATP-binding protein [Egibacteraceae bacterium]
MTAPPTPTPTPGTDGHAAVRIRGLIKRYGPVHAVNRLDLDVPPGAVFGLLGPNGAGKTTTMLALATLLTPDEGTLAVFGRDPVTEPTAVRRLVGYMPDFFGVYEGLTCAEYLDFFAAAFRLQAVARRRRVDDLLELTDLGHKRHTDVSGLSRGMQQRLGLARTLVHDPALLILDEPASGLDPRARVDVREILLELGRQGKTVLISSHILSELGELCDRIGIMRDGEMLAQGTPDDLRRAAGGGATVAARVLGGTDELERAVGVALEAGAASARVDGAVVRIEVPGGDDAVASVLAALVGRGLRVAELSDQRGGLERLFLSVTEEVAPSASEAG